MLRVRLHGRGGQGIKTAGQILGSAAFFSGLQAQDFPLYGAERRGAPIVAFARVDRAPILERGPIAVPDLLLIGDESLLEDAQAAPLCGADEKTVIFISSEHSPEALQERHSFPALPQVLGLSRICLKHLDNPMLLSAALAAAGACIAGRITLEHLLESVQVELSATGIGGDLLRANVELATEVYEVLTPATFVPRQEEPLTPSTLVSVEQKEVVDAAPLITATGNMAQKKTGNWRIHRPEIDYAACNHCQICYARCPEGVIETDSEGKPVIDYDHCKGCMICAQECPKHAIRTLWEMDYASQ